MEHDVADVGVHDVDVPLIQVLALMLGRAEGQRSAGRKEDALGRTGTRIAKAHVIRSVILDRDPLKRDRGHNLCGPWNDWDGPRRRRCDLK